MIGEGCLPMDAFDEKRPGRRPTGVPDKPVVVVVPSTTRGSPIGGQPLTKEQQDQVATQLDPAGGSYT